MDYTNTSKLSRSIVALLPGSVGLQAYRTRDLRQQKNLQRINRLSTKTIEERIFRSKEILWNKIGHAVDIPFAIGFEAASFHLIGNGAILASQGDYLYLLPMLAGIALREVSYHNGADYFEK